MCNRWSDEVHKLERFNDQNIARFLGVVEEKGHWALVQVCFSLCILEEAQKSCLNKGMGWRTRPACCHEAISWWSSSSFCWTNWVANGRGTLVSLCVEQLAFLNSFIFRYLHANGILHLNLSPGNVIYNSSNTTLKLRDYGLRTFKLANFAKETTHGNPRYVAVEVMMRQHDNISPARLEGCVFFVLLNEIA